MTPTTAAGWYADPADAAMVRWWDGVRWTQHAQPAVYGAQALPPVGPPVPPESQQPKDNFLYANGFSLIVALFAVFWFVNYYVSHQLWVGFLPLTLTYWVAKRREPLRIPAGILAGIVLVLSFYLLWRR